MKWEEFVKKHPEFEGLEDVKCPGCERTYKEIVEEGDEDSIIDARYISADGMYEYPYGTEDIELCAACYEGETTYPRGKAILYIPIGDDVWEVPVTFFDHFYFVPEDEIDEDAYDKVMKIVHEFADEVGANIFFRHTDPWRGYFDIDKSKLKNWKILHEDVALAGSEDAEELRKFDEKIREELVKRDIVHARLILGTSNLFSSGYTLMIRAKDVNKADLVYLYALVGMLRLRYRDDERFIITALTGKTSTKDFTKEDRLLVDAYRRLTRGEDPNKVLEDFKRKLMEVEK